MVMEVLGSAVGSTRERGIEDTLHADSRPPQPASLYHSGTLG